MPRSLLSVFDKLKSGNPLTGHQKSMFGVIGTLIFVALSVAIFVIWL